MSGAAHRVQLEPAFLLHHYPYRDSSRLLELLTRGHGRVAVFARASKRSASGLPSMLQPFVEVLASWTGRGEVGQLTSAERAATAATVPAAQLLSGFYVNELLVRLLPRNDPHPGLYDAYRSMIEALAVPACDPRRALRCFEKRLLEELGYGLRLDVGIDGVPIEPSAVYRVRLEAGAERIDGVAEGELTFPGASLLSLAREQLTDVRSLADAKRLLRAALDVCLDGRSLRTRDVATAMAAHRHHAEGG